MTKLTRKTKLPLTNREKLWKQVNKKVRKVVYTFNPNLYDHSLFYEVDPPTRQRDTTTTVADSYDDDSFKWSNVISNIDWSGKKLTNAINGSGIWQLMYDTAKAFVVTNRPNELKLFEKMYPKQLPRDCFINLYDVNSKSGINPHCDHVSFCTIVLCLEGNKDDSLVLIQETNEPIRHFVYK
jgi:hypothetical protein